VEQQLGPIARCAVERLMRSAGLRGARRGRRFVTTCRDAAATRPPDRVNSNFAAEAPNRLWIVDFERHVPTRSGTAFTAFVSDVFSRRIVAWRTTSIPTELPLDALEMALWTRGRDGHLDNGGYLEGLIHHSDRGFAIHRHPLRRPARRCRRARLHRQCRRLVR
jgi:putative transposase